MIIHDRGRALEQIAEAGGEMLAGGLIFANIRAGSVVYDMELVVVRKRPVN